MFLRFLLQAALSCHETQDDNQEIPKGISNSENEYSNNVQNSHLELLMQRL